LATWLLGCRQVVSQVGDEWMIAARLNVLGRERTGVGLFSLANQDLAEPMGKLGGLARLFAQARPEPAFGLLIAARVVQLAARKVGGVSCNRRFGIAGADLGKQDARIADAIELCQAFGLHEQGLIGELIIFRCCQARIGVVERLGVGTQIIRALQAVEAGLARPVFAREVL
jgi:hypothetical protein